mmetsp:Transcript_3977/g.14136  ORF Transcript_3977/g.14136 Transcript_3977/m.14136 type:complete len:112 (-) Transcript_3977:1055-1390(-)
MRVIAAYLLAQLGGNESPTADDLKNIMGAAGVEPEDGSIEKLLGELEGKDVADLIAEGLGKMAGVAGGGGGAAAPAAGGGGGGGGGAAAAAPEPEPEEEEEEEDMGFDLFD